MRELHFGMNPSATGATLRLGGSYTRKEMLYSLNLLFDRLDETGSLFWWPGHITKNDASPDAARVRGPGFSKA